MSGSRIPALIFVFSTLSAFSQNRGVVNVGVALLGAGPHTVSVVEARDRLVKALNQQKPDKKFHFAVNAIPLQTEWGTKALAEAREKNCQFVLSVQLVKLQTSSTVVNNGPAGMDNVPLFSAAVEYRLIRTADGGNSVIGSLTAEDSASGQDATWKALTQVSSRAIADIGAKPNLPSGEGAPSANSSVPKMETTFIAERPCDWMPGNIPHPEALRSVCEYATSLPQKMPNFICDQEAARYRGKNKMPFDLVTASVRYEDGNEFYDKIRINGKSAPDALTQQPGLWSTGEFGGNLVAIFDPGNHTAFEFSGESQLAGRPVWVFTYRIARQNNPLWRLHGNDEVLAPPYNGELWIDQKTHDPLRFSSVAQQIPRAFPMTAVSLQIDYAEVAFADGSSFALPADFTVTTAYRREEPTRNVVQFRNCHKFRVKTQIVLNPAAAAVPEPTEGNATADAAAGEAAEQGERIYAILREQAIREDQAQYELELAQQLNSAAADALARLSALDQQRQKFLAAEAARRAASPAPATRLDTTLRVSVRFVPVTVVLRDSNGNAVGNLHKEDFQLFDDGKPQPITSFSVESYPANSCSSLKPCATPTMVSKSLPSVPADRYVAYVFDDIHAAFEDLSSARDATERHLAALLPQDRAAVFTTSGQVGLDFTSDREKLHVALQALRPHPLLGGATCPPISPYMADLIVNHEDLEALRLATKDADNCAFGRQEDYRHAEHIAKQAAQEVLSATSNENQSTLSVLRDIFRRLADASGVRTIVLASPGFLMLTPETRQWLMDLIENALRAEIVVSTLDIHGLSVPLAAPNGMHPSDPMLRFRYDREEEQLQRDLMANLAYSTGGTYFHDSNDLDEGFRRTADVPEYIYVLGFSPTKLDGKFHKLRVKLTQASKLNVQAREGYYALKLRPGQ